MSSIPASHSDDNPTATATTTTTTSSTRTTDFPLFQQANRAAQHMSLQWIRSVFREICYQLWKDHWKVEHVEITEDNNGNHNDNHGDDDHIHPNGDQHHANNTKTTRTHCLLYMNTDMMTQAQAKCQQVADRWSARLQAQGHYQVSQWVQQVVQQEGLLAFFVDEIDNTNNLDNSTTTTPVKDASLEEQQQLGNQSSSINDDESTQVSSKNAETDGMDDDVSTENNYDNNSKADSAPISSPTTRRPTTCALAALRQVRVVPNVTTILTGNNPNHNNIPSRTREQQEQYLIDQLDALGRNGKTYWPFDWTLIEQAAQQIPQRLYAANNNLNDNTTPNLQLVPKKATEPVPANENDNNNDEELNSQENDGGSATIRTANQSDDDDEEEDHDNNTSHEWTEQMLVNYRKRRPVSFLTANNAAQEHPFYNSNDSNSNTKRCKLQHQTSRPPCRVGHWEIPWNAQVAQQVASPALDAYVHDVEQKNDDDDDDDDDIPLTLLGALKHLGHVHHVLQLPEDYPPPKGGVAPAQQQQQEGSQTQQWRRYKFAQRERLGPHRLEKDPKEQNVRSKIKRTLHTIHSNNKTGGVGGGTAANTATTFTAAEDVEDQWWDFDLGECLLDLQTKEDEEEDCQYQPGGDGESLLLVPPRRLYAFSSVEVMLLDEDEDGGGDEYDDEHELENWDEHDGTNELEMGESARNQLGSGTDQNSISNEGDYQGIVAI